MVYRIFRGFPLRVHLHIFLNICFIQSFVFIMNFFCEHYLAWNYNTIVT
jgi:hypothetical protein